MSTDPTRPLSTDWQNPRHAAPVHEKRRHHFVLWTVITLVVLALLLLAADRVAAAITENKVASQVQKSLNLSGKPSVNIEGFPFLTQLASHDLHTVVITGHNLNDGQLDFASIDATAQNVHIYGLSSATVDSLKGTATITFTSAAHAAKLPASITLSPAGGNLVKFTASALGASASGDARLSPQGSNEIHVQVVNGGALASLLGSNTSFDLPVPSLPSGVSITGVSATSGGIQINFSGTDTTFS